MLDLFEYAHKHNVSVVISPLHSTTKVFLIRMSREHFSVSRQFVLDDCIRDKEKDIQFILDDCLKRLEMNIREIRHLYSLRMEG